MIDRAGMLLSMLALLACLLAASTLHAHEAGLYDIDHACISCDVEEMGAHGALPATITQPSTTFVTDMPCALYRGVVLFTAIQKPIRGPPHHA